ncbi:MAG: hypothetical protein ACX94C_10635 [Phycisphaerales bacterium]
MNIIKPAAILALVASTASADIFDENVLGDFSGDRFAPTFLDFQLGENTVISQTVSSDIPGVGDRDYVTFSIGAGQSIDSITLVNASNPAGGFDPVGFVGMAFDSIFDFNPDTFDGPGLVGFTLTTPDTIGTDILSALSDGQSTLGPGDYSLWIQQTGADLTQIELSFNVVPAPASTALFAAAALSTSRRRRR